MRLPGRPATVLAAAIWVSAPFGATAFASCLASGAPSQATIDSMKSDPAALLKARSADLVRDVRAVVATDTAVAAGIVKDAVPKAPPAVRSALAAALGQAAKICGGRNPGAATEIQNAVLASGDSEFINAFRASSGDIRTAAVGSGTGGGAGGAFGGAGGSLGGAGVINTSGAAGRGGSAFGAIGGFSIANAAGAFSASGGSRTITYIQRASSAVSGNR